jgi:hypothetical protein
VLITDRVSRTGAFQTTDASTQAVETRIQALWRRLETEEEPHASPSPSAQRELTDVLQALTRLDVSYSDWETVYRETLRIALALRGGQRLLEQAIAQKKSDPSSRSQARRRHLPRGTRTYARKRILASTTKGVLAVAENAAKRFLAAVKR